MGHLDVTPTQLLSSEASFAERAALMRATMSTAETDASAAQAFHQGEAAIAFQTTHVRYMESMAKANALLDVATANLGEGAGTYLTQDAAAAATYPTHVV